VSFFLLVILTAAFTEFFVRGRSGFAADLVVGVIEISGMIVVTLLFYDIFRAVNRSLSSLAASFNFVGLKLELLQFNPRGAMIDIGFHGLYCLMMGYLLFRSTFLSRILARRWRLPVWVGWSFCHRRLHTIYPPTIWPWASSGKLRCPCGSS
jgi:hypothetical protein